MLTARENETLTQTNANTPMGDVFRSYWQPACLSRELPEPDCPPIRTQLFGENFVAFRDSEGTVGILESRCPHRGAELFFGRNEDCGLRCVYHGWKFDAGGNCVDMPNVTSAVADTIRSKAKLRALHVQEAGDIVWAFLGAGDPPALPQFEFMTVPPSHRYVSKKYQECNWAQAVEGGLDTSHFSFLHAGMRGGQKVGLLDVNGDQTKGQPDLNVKRFRWLADDGAPRFEVRKHQAGMLVCAARNADEDGTYWRMTQFLMPNHSLTPGNFPSDTSLGNSWVPIDDQNCWIYCYAWHPEREIGDRERERLANGSGIFAEVDDAFMPLRRRDNDYKIDRRLQRESSFTGISGISEQDQAIADSQGRVADRTKELLVQTDLGVVEFRRMIFNAVKSVAEGNTPLGAATPDAYLVRSGDFVASNGEPLDEVVQLRFNGLAGKTQ